jgi:hypothetical protein
MSRRDPVADVLGETSAGVAAAPPVPLDAPHVQRAGDEIAFTWPAQSVTLSFAGLRESSEGVHAELSIVSGVLGEIHWSRLNLASTPAREGLVRKLEHALPGAPWRPILERACRDAAREIRAGEPIVPLLPRRAPDETRYLLPKLLLAGETNLLYADGGHGKSLLALAMATAVATRSPLPGGLRPHATVPVMLLDWESYQAEHEDRLARYFEGLDLPEPPRILYRPMARALSDEIARVRAEVARHRIGLVIVDSFAPACGAEPEGSDAAIRLMNALRSLAPATRLLLAHVSKAAAESRGLTRAFGSVFVMNLARNAWELRRADEDGGSDLVLAAFHRKANAGPLLPPLGFRFQFQDVMTTLHAHDIGQAPELAARASLAFRIRSALAVGARTAADLAEAMEATEDSVSRTLRRLTTKGVVVRLSDQKPFTWGLAAR